MCVQKFPFINFQAVNYCTYNTLERLIAYTRDVMTTQ